MSTSQADSSRMVVKLWLWPRGASEKMFHTAIALHPSPLELFFASSLLESTDTGQHEKVRIHHPICQTRTGLLSVLAVLAMLAGGERAG